MLSPPPPVKWISLWSSLGFLIRSPKILAASVLLLFLTLALTWGGYLLAVRYVDGQTAGLFQQIPEVVGVWGWMKHLGWLVMKWTVFFISRVISFYLAFILAYTLSAPGYVFLSSAVEKKFAGKAFAEDAALSLKGIVTDILEGLKIGVLGLVVTIVALTANFIPIFGQVMVLLLYTYYSALLFLDYPTSRRRWSLGRKIGWMRRNGRAAFHLGILPAIISLIPFVNIFLMALLFPLLTVHATLNFSALEQAEHEKAAA
jgi:CysZ protein